MTQAYTLEVTDLVAYADSLKPDEPVGIPMYCESCWGANTLNWKYPGEKFSLDFRNHRFWHEEEEDGATSYEVVPEVASILCQFDALGDTSDPWDEDREPITKQQLLESSILATIGKEQMG